MDSYPQKLVGAGNPHGSRNSHFVGTGRQVEDSVPFDFLKPVITRIDLHLLFSLPGELLDVLSNCRPVDVNTASGRGLGIFPINCLVSFRPIFSRIACRSCFPGDRVPAVFSRSIQFGQERFCIKDQQPCLFPTGCHMPGGRNRVDWLGITH